MQEILQKQGMIGGKQMRFRCRKTPKTVSVFCSNINSYKIKSTIIKNSNSNYTFQLPPDLILPSQIFIITYSSGFEGISRISPDSGEMVIFKSDLYTFFKFMGDSFNTEKSFYSNGVSNVKANTSLYTGGYGIIFYKTKSYIDSSGGSSSKYWIQIEYIQSSHSIRITQPEQFYFQTDIYKNGAGTNTDSQVQEYGNFTSRLATTPKLSITYVV